jgi:argininosuccinate lyase
MLAYVEMFRRDIDRLDDAYRRANVMPLGSGALAGTTFPIDRAWVASELGFAALSRNSLDAVGDRDFIVEFVSDCSLIMTHTSRLAEEFVWWSSAEFGFVQLSDAYATGSSMMPQKKNPDSAELIRGKTGRVFGHLIGLLSVLKGIPLAYDKDLQEDKEPLFDTVATVRGCLAVLRGVLDTLVVRSQTMREATRGGYLTATDLADYLVRKGLPFRDAHEVVGRLVAYCDEHKRDVEDLTFEEYQRFSPLFEANVAEVVTVDASVAARDIPGGTAPNRVRDALEEAKSYIEARSRERR